MWGLSVNYETQAGLAMQLRSHPMHGADSEAAEQGRFKEGHGMADVDRQCFTVGVFQDVGWAQRGLEALADKGFASESLSLISKETPQAVELLRRTFGVDGVTLNIARIGSVVAHGPLVGALQHGDEHELDRTGVAATMHHVGFQAHDGFIYEPLTARGGVLVGVHSEPRAADALAVMFAYGGGNAAIGAWAGRV